jgi:hypothetical protein
MSRPSAPILFADGWAPFTSALTDALPSKTALAEGDSATHCGLRRRACYEGLGMLLPAFRVRQIRGVLNAMRKARYERETGVRCWRSFLDHVRSAHRVCDVVSGGVGEPGLLF